MTGEINNMTSSECPRWLKVALVASLALNLVVIGVFAGHSMKEDRRGGGANQQVEWIIKLMPEGCREFARSRFEPQREVLALEQRKRLQQLTDVIEAIRSEPFVPETLSADLAARRGSSVKRRELVHEELVSILNECSAQDRVVFANNIEDQLRKAREARAERASY